MELSAFVFLMIFSGVYSLRKRCESITISMCKNIGYNYTSMPNKFHHADQKEAEFRLADFMPLVETRCSDDLVFFLCSLYVPVCIDDYEKQLSPCSSVCVRVKSDCSSIMRKYGFSWPKQMKCGNFPKYGNHEHLCMDSKEGSTRGKSDYLSKRERKAFRKRTSIKMESSKSLGRLDLYSPAPLVKPKPTQISRVAVNSECRCDNRYPLISINSTKFQLYDQINSKEVSDNASPCKILFFTENQRNFTAYWIGLWSIISCIASSLTVLTFIIDESRFFYPERPIIFLSGCYVMISIGYFLCFVLGQETVACDGQVAFYQKAGEAPTFACTAVFILIYFFTMASSLWWIILSFTWFLAAGLKWGGEAINGYSHYYHYVAWLLPTAKSIIILWIGAIDGDTISGVCSVGNQNVIYLKWFMILPLSSYSTLGAVFLIIGFVSLFRIRSVVKEQSPKEANKLEKLMLKIGVFSILHVIPMVIQIACLSYEYLFRESWIQWHKCPCEGIKSQPHHLVFLLKYFSTLVLGIVSMFWIASRKTVESWCRLFCTYTSKGIDDVGFERTLKPAIQELEKNIFNLYTIS